MGDAVLWFWVAVGVVLFAAGLMAWGSLGRPLPHPGSRLGRLLRWLGRELV